MNDAVASSLCCGAQQSIIALCHIVISDDNNDSNDTWLHASHTAHVRLWRQPHNNFVVWRDARTNSDDRSIFDGDHEDSKKNNNDDEIQAEGIIGHSFNLIHLFVKKANPEA